MGRLESPSSKDGIENKKEDVHLVLDISQKGVWYPAKAKEVTIGFSKTGSKKSKYEGGRFKELNIGESDSPVEQRISILAIGKKKENKIIKGRAVIGYSNACQSITATIRLEDRLPDHSTPCIKKQHSAHRRITSSPTSTEFLFSSDACIDEIMWHLGLLNSDPRKTSENSVNPSFIFNNEVIEKPGLIVLAGATKGGKSLYSKGIALRYIFGLAEENHSVTEETLPHLVSVEDPIESWDLFEAKGIDDGSSETTKLSIDPRTENSTALGLWFTPRELEKDVLSLEVACDNALRQTPACFFVGEVRNDDDWQHILKVSRTGHLVICTCHSASLTETFAKILRSQSSKEAFDRKALAEALLGVVHLKSTQILTDSSDSGPRKINFPMFQIWKQNPNSIADFCSDGLSSIVPDGCNTFSTRRVFQGILERQKEYNKLNISTETQKRIVDYDQDLYKQALSIALKHDLGG